MAKKLESEFQSWLIKQLRAMFPGCYILKNDSAYLTGVPDLLVLWQNRWATLEVKRSLREKYEPNQEYHIDMMNRMSFSAMICPENATEILYALQQSFRAGRLPRLPLG